ncbi:MAG: choice-of-anchor D domain-containing protein, partial [Planctomycetota bacterium]
MELSSLNRPSSSRKARRESRKNAQARKLLRSALKRVLHHETLEPRQLLAADCFYSEPQMETELQPVRQPLSLPTPEGEYFSDELVGSGSGSSSYTGSSSSSGGFPTISNVQLVNDTGVSQDDKITTDPTVQGNIDGAFWSYGTANVEFDHDGDGSGDGVVAATSQGVPFQYDPRVSDPAIANHTGPLTLNYRALEFDGSGNLTYQGPWQAFQLTMEADDASEISITDENSQNVQSGFSTINLGSTPLNTAVTRDFTVNNLGAAALTLDVANLTLPNGFTLKTPPATSVDPYSQTTFTLEVAATTAGSFSGEFSLPTNDSDENPFRFNLLVDVVGPSPEISLADASNNNIADGTGSLGFGTTVEGTAVEKTVTISNSGDSDLVIDPSSVQIPNGFSLVGTFDMTIVPSASTTMTLRLDGTAEGSFQGDVVFSSNDADESPFSFQVTGVVDPNPSSPAIVDFQLLNNDGVSSNDHISSDSTVTATVVGDFAGGSVTIEFDHSGDGLVDGSVDVASTGSSFNYDPRIAEAALAGATGWSPLQYRRIHKDSAGAVVSTGAWNEYAFIVDSDAVAGAISINDYELDQDTGSSNQDRLSISPVVKGTVSGDFAGGSALIEFARPNTDLALGSVAVAASGDAFEFDPRLVDGTLTGFVGRANVRYRLIHLDSQGASVSTGSWLNFGIALEEAPAGGFHINELALVNDDGTSDSDKYTTDPTLSGKVAYNGQNYSNPPSPAYAVVQYDQTGDGTIDGTVVADAEGNFEFRPSGLTYQQHTIRVRALEWSLEYATYLPGPWKDTMVHLAPPASPGIEDFRLMADTGISTDDSITANPSVTGRVAVEESGIPGSEIHFDYDGDNVTDATTFADDYGYFAFRPRGLSEGEVTIGAKSLYWDATISAHVYSPSVSLTFTYQPPPLPAIEWMDLAIDDGDSHLDRVTTKPMVMGQLKTTSLRSAVYMEYDTNNDGTVDAHGVSDAYGSFVFEPTGITAGAVTIQARTKLWDYDAGQWRVGDWNSLSFTLEAVAAPTLGVDSVSLRRDTGADESDGITSEPTIVGTLQGTATVAQQLVEIDVNNDGVGDGQTLTDLEGNFSYVPVGLAVGQHTVQVRTKHWDHINSTGVYGAWQPITFNLQPDVNIPPVITSLGLAYDSGSSQTDNNSENPLLV